MSKTYNWGIEQIAAQCVMPRLNSTEYFEKDDYRSRIIELVQKGITGFCLFGGKYDDVMLMISELQTYAETPLIFSADMEHGLPMRFEDGTEYPHHMALAKTKNIEYTEKAAKEIAKEASNLGVKWNFAPVVDINSNPKNPVINIRSFGESINTVCEHSIAYIKGTQLENVIATAKHFPGHGDTDTDSHLKLPLLDHSEEKIRNMDLIPFKKAVEAGVKSVMTGHLSVPSLDNSGLPASLSEKMITILKDELNFQGLIITDALEMKAITEKFNNDEAAYMALKAGNDIALMPENPEKAIDLIIENAKNDDDFLEQLKNSSEKIIKHKRWCGLIPYFGKADFEPKAFIQNQKSALIIADAAFNYEGNSSLIPISENKQYAGFAFLNSESNLRAATRFYTMLAQATENDVDFAYFDKNISDENIEELVKGTEDAEFILFPVFLKGGAYTENLETGEFLSEKMKKLANGKPSIAIIFGSPYIKDHLPNDLKILAYSDSFASLAAGVVHLSGRREALKL